jgi:hypothetical protein
VQEAVKFVIEILRSANGADTEVLRRLTIEAISPSRAKADAHRLLDALKGRGANQARVLNHSHEEIFRLP